jgi:hypothetical protein
MDGRTIGDAQHGQQDQYGWLISSLAVEWVILETSAPRTCAACRYRDACAVRCSKPLFVPSPSLRVYPTTSIRDRTL